MRGRVSCVAEAALPSFLRSSIRLRLDEMRPSSSSPCRPLRTPARISYSLLPVSPLHLASTLASPSPLRPLRSPISDRLPSHHLPCPLPRSKLLPPSCRRRRRSRAPLERKGRRKNSRGLCAAVARLGCVMEWQRVFGEERKSMGMEAEKP
jgi:hypothetical protein